MKITMLRLMSGCYAFKGAQNVMAGPTCTIEAVGGGDYLVDFHGELVRLPSHRVDFAKVERDSKAPVTKK